MTGGNCAIPGCHTSRRPKYAGISLFKVPKGKDHFATQWREKMIAVIKEHREMTPSLQEQINKVTLEICERHFRTCDILQSK